MIRLTTLASVDLKGPDDAPLRSVLNQPKRLALLAYLALTAKSAPQRRDALLGLFWAESRDEKARNALNQAVFFLRKALGKDAIVSRGPEDVGIDPSLVWCDAVAFEEAVDAGRREEALTLYRGDFLRGFFVEDAPEFERWVEAERQRLRARAVRAAHELADREEASGDLRTAVQWTRRELELSQDERALRRLIELLDRAGDRAGALQAYETFTQRLAAEYEVEPSPETVRLVETIRSRRAARDPGGTRGADGSPARAEESWPASGARGAGTESSQREARAAEARDPTEPRSRPGDGSPAEPPTPAQAGGRRGRSRRRVVLSWLAVAAALAIMLVPELLERPLGWGGRTPIERARPRVAVLPFEDPSGTGEANYLADGLTAALVSQLSEVRALEIISKDGLRSLGVEGLPRDSMAHELDIDLMVSGTVLQSEGRTRITVQLVDAGSGATLRSIPVERASGDLFSLLDATTQELSSALRKELGREIRLKEWRSGTKDMEAWALLQRAERQREDAHALRAAGAFEAEIDALLAADSLLAAAETRDSRWVDPIIRRSAVAAELGWQHYRPFMRDRQQHQKYWNLGVDHARRALSLDSKNAAAFEIRGMLRHRMAMLAAPGPDSARTLRRLAEADYRAAVANDERRALAWTGLSSLLFARGEFAEAKVAAERAYAADAYLESAQEILSRLVTTSLEVGASAEARRWCDEVQRRFGHTWTEAVCRLNLLALSEDAEPTTPAQVQEILGGAEIPQVLRPLVEPQLQMTAAAALARSGHGQEAERMLSRARERQAIADPELLRAEAAARVLLGQPDSALALLTQYVRAKPSGRSGLLTSRSFVSLRGLPGFPGGAPANE